MNSDLVNFATIFNHSINHVFIYRFSGPEALPKCLIFRSFALLLDWLVRFIDY